MFFFYKNQNFKKTKSPKHILNTMTYYTGWICIKIWEKKSASGFLRHWWNSTFPNTVLKIFRICDPNITWSEKAKDDKIFMIYNIFYFKCAINLNDNFRITWRKAKICPLNITVLYKFFYGITTRSTKRSLFSHKHLTKRKIKISTSSQI